KGLGLETADGRVFVVMRRLPWTPREPHRQQTLACGVPLIEVLPAFVPVVRSICPHTKCRSDILQVVHHDGTVVVFHDGVERVARLHVGEIRPGAEYAQRTQLASMFVRDDIVGVVGPRALVSKRADDTSWQET